MPEDPIIIQSFTWNMGNKKASETAINNFINNIEKDNEGNPLNTLPTVISISTQEELASDKERLGKQLCQRLNEGLDPKEQYVLVAKVSHTTMAGANNSLTETLPNAVFTDKNRVSTMVLVKKPYEFEVNDKETRIDYQPGEKKDKNKKVNKSVITISGTLKKGNEVVMPIAISGVHMDANKKGKRNDLTNKYLKNSNLKTKETTFKPLNFKKIAAEAKCYRLIGGDFNQRYEQYGKKATPKDTFELNSPLARRGFNFKGEFKVIYNKKELNGTYGVKVGDDNFTYKHDKKSQSKKGQLPKRSPNDCNGGNLDMLLPSTGHFYVTSKHGFKVSEQISEQKTIGKSKKTAFLNSDHMPATRIDTVTPSDNDNIIVSKYVADRIPSLGEEQKFLTSLSETITKDLKLGLPLKKFKTLLANQIRERMPTTPEFKDNDVLKMYFGSDDINIIQQKITNKLDTISSFNSLKSEGLIAQDQNFTTTLFNKLNLCHDIHDALEDIKEISDKKMPLEDKIELIKLTQQILDQAYHQTSKGEMTPFNKETVQEISDFINKFPKLNAINSLSVVVENYNNYELQKQAISQDLSQTQPPSLPSQRFGATPPPLPPTPQVVLPTFLAQSQKGASFQHSNASQKESAMEQAIEPTTKKLTS